MLTRQLDGAAGTVGPQPLFETVKGPLPGMVTGPEIVNGTATAPLLVSVKLATVGVPTAIGPKFSIPGLTMMGKPTPLPLRLMVCGPPFAVTVMVPVRVPGWLGVNVSTTPHCVFAGRDAAQLLFTTRKSLLVGEPTESASPD